MNTGPGEVAELIDLEGVCAFMFGNCWRKAFVVRVNIPKVVLQYVESSLAVRNVFIQRVLSTHSRTVCVSMAYVKLTVTDLGLLGCSAGNVAGKAVDGSK